MLKKEGVPFFPDAILRDAVVTLALCLTVLALAIFIGPPQLGKPPDPTLIDAVPRPDWYLMWYFAVLRCSHTEPRNTSLSSFRSCSLLCPYSCRCSSPRANEASGGVPGRRSSCSRRS